MNRSEIEVRTILKRHLASDDYELADFLNVPLHGDRLLRQQVLEEAIQQAESGTDADTQIYVIRVRKKEKAITASALRPSTEQIYKADGKINSTYLFKNADLLLRAGDIALARKIYRTIIQSEPSAEAFFGLGRCAESEGKIEEALKAYEDSVAFSPNFNAIYRSIRINIDQGQHQRALEWIDRASNLKAIDARQKLEIYSLGAELLVAHQDGTGAERYVRKMAEIDAVAAITRSLQAKTHLLQNRVPEAKMFFREILNTHPRDIAALLGLAQCLAREGDDRGAYETYHRILEIQPNHADALYEFVRLAYKVKSFALAVQRVEEYIDSSPVSPNLLYTLAGLQYHLGRFGEADHTLQRVLEMQPEHSAAQEMRELIRKYQGT